MMPKIKHRAQNSALMRLWLGILKKDMLKLTLACCLMGTVILTNAFFFHFYDQRQKEAALDAERRVMLHQINRAITDRLSFLVEVLEGVTDAHQIRAVLGSLSDLPHHVLSDTFVVQGNTKVTKRGSVPFLTTGSLPQKQSVFRDHLGYICFVKQGLDVFYSVRLSMTSLASALDTPAASLSLSLAPDPLKQRALPLAQKGWLVFKEPKPSLVATFITQYFWLMVSLPLITLLFMGGFLLLYSHVFFTLNRAYRLYKADLEQAFQTLKTENLVLTTAHQHKTKMAAALRKKQKIQAEVFQDLSKRRQKLLEKTSDIARLVSHAFDDDKKVLEASEISKLLLEISKAATLLSEGLFEPKVAPPISLAQETQRIAAYLAWSLLKSEVTLKIEIDEEEVLEVDQMGFTLLFLNLLLRHIDRAPENALILFSVTQKENCLAFKIDCENSFQIKTPFDPDRAANPLVLPDEALAKLAEALGFSSLLSGVKQTTLIYPLQESSQVVEGDNIVALFH